MSAHLRTVILFFFWTVSFTAAALDPKLAHREAGRSYLFYKMNAAAYVAPLWEPLGASVLDQARRYGEGGLPAATLWDSKLKMQSRFELLRDKRWLSTSEHKNFLRRSSWLYPDDGCFARAALAVLNATRMQAPAPMKIFAFGDLAAKTPNSPLGEVLWWYHVAPVVEIEGVKYVLDPSIDPKRPLTVDEWLGAMSPNPSDLEVAICGSGSYTPYSYCERQTDGIERQAGYEQIGFLYDEWDRLLDLGRSPENELGDYPPWRDLTRF